MPVATFPSGRTKGVLALTEEEHKWLLSAVPSGLVTKYEAAAKLKISIPTVNAWLRRPVGYTQALGGRPKREAATSDKSAAHGPEHADGAIGGYPG